MKDKRSPSGVENPAQREARALRIGKKLEQLYPDAGTTLKHRDPFQLLVATILSAQCTDVKVNQVTPHLFKRFPDAKSLARADAREIETLIRSTGFFRQKTKSIINCARGIMEEFGGQMPQSMEDLTRLPGVGRKTANVVRGTAMGEPGIVVDTHVKRLTGLLGLTGQTNPDKIEFDLMELLPPRRWTRFSNALIWHGRRICIARRPKCDECPLLADCPHGQSRV